MKRMKSEEVILLEQILDVLKDIKEGGIPPRYVD